MINIEKGTFGFNLHFQVDNYKKHKTQKQIEQKVIAKSRQNIGNLSFGLSTSHVFLNHRENSMEAFSLLNNTKQHMNFLVAFSVIKT